MRRKRSNGSRRGSSSWPWPATADTWMPRHALHLRPSGIATWLQPTTPACRRPKRWRRRRGSSIDGAGSRSFGASGAAGPCESQSVRPRVWTQVVLAPGPMERLSSIADVVLDSTPAHDALPGADVAIVGPAYVEAPFLERAGPSLRMVVRHGIGFDRVNVPACSAVGVLTANTPDGPTESTAEHAVAMLLALAKRLQPSAAAMRAG